MRDGLEIGLLIGFSVGTMLGLLFAQVLDHMLEGWDFGDE